ncbi:MULTISPECIES: alpha/beta hydrolase [Mesorhizobium]|uniref:alpha/beta fold hydrolase n=1 Tax=Mesorhizobium sp. TaxID=1871066 RepID=UPI000B157648|nr:MULTISPECIES: alpha/beta hydrolase [Mesorhizobium]RWM69175.1 MAG: alpha/beta hydrolase [Mesorhizobium sp.]TIO20878.1 MAG: alpha/beta hydrolase [Mesorhizobium sp.]TJV55115.1 MAG: alpha/beta hydrolase [Mesorhizobium sp.]
MLLGAGLAGLALYNGARAKRALFSHLSGRFVEAAGVRLHLLEQGSGMPLILLHGNGSFAEDFKTSGVFDLAAGKYRVLAFDRPGFGRSARLRGKWWTAAAQADLIHAAVAQLGIERYLVLGHSWGASVAIQLARLRPASVAGIVLVSGYYHPPPRLGLALAALPALPVAGGVVRHTLLPLLVRLTWPLAMAKIFRPGIISAEFASSAKDVASRPSQLRSIAAESALMLVAALAGGRSARYNELSLPTGIVAGAGDRLFDAQAEAVRLQAEIYGSFAEIIPQAGHMVHHAAPQAILAMIDKVAAAGGGDPA